MSAMDKWPADRHNWQWPELTAERSSRKFMNRRRLWS